MRNNVYCLSRYDFGQVVKGLTEQQFMATAFISIHEPKSDVEMYGGCSDVILEEAPNVLNLWFDDAEEDLWMPDPYKVTLFDGDMAGRVAGFINANLDKKTWLIHCTMGQCRSGAIGDVLSSFLGIDYWDFKRNNPKVKPNALVKNLLIKSLFDAPQ